MIPAQFRVIVTRRPKYGCRACESAVVQAPAPARLIEGGLPTEALVAHVLVSKYADHLPLYRQSQIYARQGIELDRSTLADWVGRAAAELRPLHERLFEHLKALAQAVHGRDPRAGARSGAQADQDRLPVGDRPRRPARGRVPIRRRSPISTRPGRGAEHAIGPLAGFTGVLQVDGYAAYKALADPARAGGPVTLAYCWSHVRRRFYEIAQGGNAPIAEAALQRINALYHVEAMIRGHAPEQRQAVRQEQSRPVVDDLRTWLDAQLAKVPAPRPHRRGHPLRPQAVVRARLFLDDGRIEIDTNMVERAIRPIALNRKNALFAGSDQGGVHWGVIASLIETCKLNAVDPQAYLADVLSRLVNRHPASQIDQLMPWAYANLWPENSAYGRTIPHARLARCQHSRQVGTTIFRARYTGGAWDKRLPFWREMAVWA